MTFRACKVSTILLLTSGFSMANAQEPTLSNQAQVTTPQNIPSQTSTKSTQQLNLSPGPLNLSMYCGTSNNNHTVAITYANSGPRHYCSSTCYITRNGAVGALQCGGTVEFAI